VPLTAGGNLETETKGAFILEKFEETFVNEIDDKVVIRYG